MAKKYLVDEDPQVLFYDKTTNKKTYQHRVNVTYTKLCCIGLTIFIFLLILLTGFTLIFSNKSPSQGICGDSLCYLVSLSTTVVKEGESSLNVITNSMSDYSRLGLSHIVLYDEWNREEFQNRTQYSKMLKSLIDEAIIHKIKIHFYLGMGDYFYFFRMTIAPKWITSVDVEQVIERIFDISSVGVNSIILGSITENIIIETSHQENLSNPSQIVNLIKRRLNNVKNSPPRIFIDLIRSTYDELVQVTHEISNGQSLLDGILVEPTKFISDLSLLIAISNLPANKIVHHLGNSVSRGPGTSRIVQLLYQMFAFLPSRMIVYSEDMMDANLQIPELQRIAFWNSRQDSPEITMLNYTVLMTDEIYVLYRPMRRKNTVLFMANIDITTYSLDLYTLFNMKNMYLLNPRVLLATRMELFGTTRIDLYSVPMDPYNYAIIEGRLFKNVTT